MFTGASPGIGPVEVGVAAGEAEELIVDTDVSVLPCVDVCVGVVDAFDEIAKPLFQTSFFPDLMQVYLMFDTTLDEFNFVQDVPVTDAEFAGKMEAINIALIKVATRGNLVRSMS